MRVERRSARLDRRVATDEPRDTAVSSGGVQAESSDLAHRAELYRLLIDSVRDYAIYALTPEGIIASWNAGAQRLKGYAAGEILGHHLSEFYPSDDKLKCEQALHRARTEGRAEGEGWRVRKDGSRFWANAIISALYDEHRAIIGFVKITRDLTERRESELRRIADAARLASEETARRDAERTAAELAEANRKLQIATAAAERARSEADRARAEADAANQAKSTFLAVASHELRTPINAIIGYTDLISDEIVGPLNDVQRNQLGRVGISARHLLALIENVLALSRIEAGKDTVLLERAEAGALARDSAALVAPSANAKGLRFIVEVPETPCWISTDETKARQVLINLLSNAVKFTNRGSVSIAVRVEPSFVRFVVHDTGVGIESSALNRVFDAYWRGNQGSNRSAGTGLGLSVAQRLAVILGGVITVESQPGTGSTFKFTLPEAGGGESAAD